MTDATMASAGGLLLDVAGYAIALFLVLLQGGTALLLLRALPVLWRHWDPAQEPALADVLVSAALPTVSVVVTGRARAPEIVTGLQALLALDYPRHEVVLVHDGTASGALDVLISAFDLYAVPPAVLVNVPTGAVQGYYRSRRHGKLFVIDKTHTGDADDLNAALNASRFPYILTLDVRTRLASDALQRLMRPFLLGRRAAAVAGTVRIARGRRTAGAGAMASWLAGVQAVETLRDAAIARLGWNRAWGQLQLLDTVLLHRRDHLLEMDGYRPGAATELDLLVRLREHLCAQRLSDAVPVIPDAVAWTAGTTAPSALARRRRQAYAGQLAVLREHRRTLLSARLGARRLLAPLQLLAVSVAAPVLELAGWLLLAVVVATRGADDPFVPLFLLAVPGFGLLLSLWAIALEAVTARRRRRDLARLLAFAVAEQLGYRQWLAWHRLRVAWGAVYLSSAERASTRPRIPLPSE